MRRPFDDTGTTEPTLAFALSAETLSLDDLDEMLARCESSTPPAITPAELDPTELIARAIRETLSEQLGTR